MRPARAIAFGLLGLLGLLALAGCSQAPSENADEACVQARMAVEDHLVAPRTADFSDCSEETAKKQPDGSWAVGGYVDAQNGFGAKLRNTYLVRLAYDADAKPQWQAVSVEIEPR